MLRISPLHDNMRDCIEDSIVSVVSWLGRDYELLFAESWGFSFIDNMESGHTISDKISPGKGSIYNALKQYLNIELNIYSNKSIKEYLSIAYEEFKKDRPLLIFTDAYWTPWDDHYQKQHLDHASLLVGRNITRSKFYCIDPYYGKYGLIFPLKDFKAGCTGCAVFDIKSISENEFDWKDIIKNAVRLLQGVTHSSSNSFSAMNAFRSYLENNYIDIKYEMHGYEYVWWAPLFRRLLFVENGRRKFSCTVKYLSRKYDIKDLEQMGERLTMAANTWNKVKSMVLKYYLNNNFNEKKNNLISCLNEIINQEQSIMNDMKALVNDGNENVRINASMDFVASNNHSEGEIVFVDLKEYFNNNGFATDIADQCIADFTGVGESFLSKEIPAGEIWEVKNMKFKFPAIKKGVDDNLCCKQQTIPVNQLYCVNIMILGCSEWGDFSDYLTIQYSDGKIQKIPFGFSDWLEENPYFGEKIAWVGRGILLEQGKIKYIPSPLHIFANQYHLKGDHKVQNIILPRCPNIHIFGISLAIV